MTVELVDIDGEKGITLVVFTSTGRMVEIVISEYVTPGGKAAVTLTTVAGEAIERGNYLNEVAIIV